MENYLATTGISQIWDKDRSLLFLGPWCLTGKRAKEALGTRAYMLLPSPWKPAGKVKAAEEYCRSTYEALLPDLGAALNKAHALDYPDKYWRILLEPWLYHFVTVFYDRFKRMELAASLYPDFHTHVLQAENCALACHDTHDFIDKASDDYYNLKIFSLVVRRLYPQNLIESDFSASSEVKRVKISWKKKNLYGILNRILSRGRMVCAEMYHLDYFDMLRLKSLVGFSSLGFAEFITDGPAGAQNAHSMELRSSIKVGAGCDRFSSLLNAIIPEAIPASYLENYRVYKDAAAGFKINPRPAAVGSSIGWFFNEFFKFYAAEAAAGGAALLDFQHGGAGYGFSASMPMEKLSSHKDAFYSWGRDLPGKDNQRPLPSAHLSKLRNKYNRATNKILFVGTEFPRYVYRFHNFLMPEDMPDYFAAQVCFFSALRADLKKNILYRGYFDYGWAELPAARAACPGMRFVRKGRLTDRIKMAGVVVIDHPHTAFLEALVINAPCVFYWDHDVYLLRSEAEKYFDRLRQAGILHKDPQSASAKVNEIYDDPVAWWLDEARQQARREFCDRYAYADKDWLNIWAKELGRFL